MAQPQDTALVRRATGLAPDDPAALPLYAAVATGALYGLVFEFYWNALQGAIPFAVLLASIGGIVASFSMARSASEYGSRARAARFAMAEVILRERSEGGSSDEGSPAGALLRGYRQEGEKATRAGRPYVYSLPFVVAGTLLALLSAGILVIGIVSVTLCISLAEVILLPALSLLTLAATMVLARTGFKNPVPLWESAVPDRWSELADAPEPIEQVLDSFDWLRAPEGPTAARSAEPPA